MHGMLFLFALLTLTRTVSFTAKSAGEGRLELSARAPGKNWAVAGRESAVLTVTLDGAFNQNVVLFNGDAAQKYDLMLGPIAPGKHTVSITGSDGVVDRVTVSVIKPTTDRDYVAWKHAPILYGRPDNATTDVPLLLYFSDEPLENGRRRIVYSLIWSNEDGGTGNDVKTLLARWGRTTDIEWIYDLTLTADGTVESAVIQGDNHRTRPFAGAYRGSHPILRTSTTNNMVSDAGMSPLLFCLAPTGRLDPKAATRESMMDRFPWTHAVAEAELLREQKIDLRDFLSVDVDADVASGAGYAIRVRVGDATVVLSDGNLGLDSGVVDKSITRGGWVRTAVAVPAGRVSEIAVVRRGTGAVRVKSVRAFRLDDRYRPERPLARWTGDREITTPLIVPTF